jgi:ferric-chelate reductase [NAD(P)H]
MNLEGVDYRIGKAGAPLVTENAVAYLEAKVIQGVDVGSHTIFIGNIVDADVISDEASMTYEYYHQVKRGTTPRTAPSYIEEKRR